MLAFPFWRFSSLAGVEWTVDMHIRGFELVPETGQCFPARLRDSHRMMRVNLQDTDDA